MLGTVVLVEEDLNCYQNQHPIPISKFFATDRQSEVVFLTEEDIRSTCHSPVENIKDQVDGCHSSKIKKKRKRSPKKKKLLKKHVKYLLPVMNEWTAKDDQKLILILQQIQNASFNMRNIREKKATPYFHLMTCFDYKSKNK